MKELDFSSNQAYRDGLNKIPTGTKFIDRLGTEWFYIGILVYDNFTIYFERVGLMYSGMTFNEARKLKMQIAENQDKPKKVW